MVAQVDNLLVAAAFGHPESGGAGHVLEGGPHHSVQTLRLSSARPDGQHRWWCGVVWCVVWCVGIRLVVFMTWISHKFPSPGGIAG